MSFDKDPYSIRRTIGLLNTLAMHFTEKTEVFEVPAGVMQWRFAKAESARPFRSPNGGLIKHIVVDLVPFFGLVVGYCDELDILVYWKP